MREQRNDRQHVIQNEKQLERRDMKTGGSEIEVRIEISTIRPSTTALTWIKRNTAR